MKYITPILGTMAVLELACPTTRPPAPARVPDASTDAGISKAPVDAGPATLPEASLVASWDGGAIDLTSTPDASVPPLALLRFQTSARLVDVRVRVLDDQDHLQPNHAILAERDGGLEVTVQPTAPLAARQCCRFVIDGERQPLAEDATGRFYLPYQRRFRVTAPAVTPASERTHHRRRRHRRRA